MEVFGVMYLGFKPAASCSLSRHYTSDISLQYLVLKTFLRMKVV